MAARRRARVLWLVTGLFFVWLFAPILVVALFSLNSQDSLQVFGGFSLRWYDAFLSNRGLRASLVASLEISR